MAVFACLELGNLKMCSASRILLAVIVICKDDELQRLRTVSFVILSLQVIFKILRRHRRQSIARHKTLYLRIRLVAQWLECSPPMRFDFQSSHIWYLKIGSLSTQLGTQLESDVDETRGLSSRAGHA